MRVVPFAKSRDRYAELLDSVVADGEEVMVVRPGREPVVLVSLASYETLREMAAWRSRERVARRSVAAFGESGDGGPEE